MRFDGKGPGRAGNFWTLTSLCNSDNHLLPRSSHRWPDEFPVIYPYIICICIYINIYYIHGTVSYCKKCVWSCSFEYSMILNNYSSHQLQPLYNPMPFNHWHTSTSIDQNRVCAYTNSLYRLCHIFEGWSSANPSDFDVRAPMPPRPSDSRDLPRSVEHLPEIDGWRQVILKRTRWKTAT